MRTYRDLVTGDTVSVGQLLDRYTAGEPIGDLCGRYNVEQLRLREAFLAEQRRRATGTADLLREPGPVAL